MWLNLLVSVRGADDVGVNIPIISDDVVVNIPITVSRRVASPLTGHFRFFFQDQIFLPSSIISSIISV
jgi:hypothetical protein